MPPLPAISDAYRVAIRWGHTNGQFAINVMHIRKVGSTSAAVAASLDANVTAGMWGQIVNAASANLLTVTKLDGSSATYQLAVSGAKWTGTAGVVDFVPQACEIVSLRTGLRGRSYRGRLFLPFIGESAMSNGSIVGFAATQTAWNTWLAAMIAAASFPAVGSYKVPTLTDITSVIVESLAATQRKRQSRLRS